ncbi:MAG: SPFH domain-containing protein, partial [Chloroflexia bacterium]
MSEEQPSAASEEPQRMGLRRLLAILRLLLIVVLLILILVELWKGRWYAVLAWLLTTLVLLDTSVNVFYSMFEDPGSRWLGLVFWIASFMLGMRGVQRINAEGKLVVTRPQGPLGKLFAQFGVPGQLIIEGGMAAVLERLGEFTRVVGPGRHNLQRYERVAHVVDLRPQVRRIKVESVRTAEGLPFDIELEARFRIATTKDVSEDHQVSSPGSDRPKTPSGNEQGTGGSKEQKRIYDFSPEAIRGLVYDGGIVYDKEARKLEDWRDSVVRVIRQVVRDVSAALTVQSLLVSALPENAREQPQAPGTQGAEDRLSAREQPQAPGTQGAEDRLSAREQPQAP